MVDTQINKQITLYLSKSAPNYKDYSSDLIIRVKIEASLFESLEIKYREYERFPSNEYFKRRFEVDITHHGVEITVDYEEENNSPKKTPPGYAWTEFKYEENIEREPTGWEEVYLRSKEHARKLLNNQITVDEVKQMMKELIDNYEPEDYNNPTNAFVKSLFEFVKSIIDNDEYEAEVEIEDI